MNCPKCPDEVEMQIVSHHPNDYAQCPVCTTRLNLTGSTFKQDAVNHPAHYGGADNPYEAIKVIRAWMLGFSPGNAVKYIARAGKKGDALEDLKKARWYLDEEIKFRESRPALPPPMGEHPFEADPIRVSRCELCGLPADSAIHS